MIKQKRKYIVIKLDFIAPSYPKTFCDLSSQWSACRWTKDHLLRIKRLGEGRAVAPSFPQVHLLQSALTQLAVQIYHKARLQRSA